MFSLSHFVFQHVHVHVLPRKRGDFEKNDSIYDEVSDAFLDESSAIFNTKTNVALLV